MKVDALMMSNMMIRAAAISGLLLLTAGCTTILNTDFESEGGPWPSGPLPGPPRGDAAEVQGEVLGLGESVSLMSAGSARLDLITGGQPHNTDGYTISFTGVKLTISEVPVVVIQALDADENLACGLEISGGEFRFISGEGEQAIGQYTGNADQHRVLMRLNLGVETCFVQIEQVEQGFDGPPEDAPVTVPLITATAPLVTPGFAELDRLRVAWEEAQGVPPTQYFLGAVEISKDN